MLFLDFSSAFNTVWPMKLIGKLHTLSLSATLCDWILDFLTIRPQTVQLAVTPRLHYCREHGSWPKAVCSSPSCLQFTPMTALPDIKRTLFLRWEVWSTTPPSPVAFHTSMGVHIVGKSTVLQSVARRTIYWSTSAKHTSLSISEELKWSSCRDLVSWEKTTPPPGKKKKKKKKKKKNISVYFLRKIKKELNFLVTLTKEQ